MPEPGMPPQPGASPPGGAPAPQPAGGNPAGPGGASMPTANRGLEAKALASLAVLVQGMQTILAGLPAGSDVARDVREAVNKVAKHVPPGAISQGVQMSEAQQALMRQQHMGPQIAAMRAGGGRPGGAPPQPQPPPQPMAA